MPLTAVDAFYAIPFPTYEELNHFVLHDLPVRVPHIRPYNIEWVGELGLNNHQLLKSIFESKLNKNVVCEVGTAINERGGMTAMIANFYIYCHFAGERMKDMGLTGEQWREIHDQHAKSIENMWDGIGQWMS